MHLTQQQIAVVVAIVVEVPSTFALAMWAWYYGCQAMANIKPDSPYRWGTPFSWQVVQNTWNLKWIPRNEFTERGLWYRRRAIIASIAFAAWWVVLIFANVIAIRWFTARRIGSW